MVFIKKFWRVSFAVTVSAVVLTACSDKSVAQTERVSSTTARFVAEDNTAIIAAREAVRKGRWDSLPDLINQTQSHRLAAYPEYWRLSQELKLNRASSTELNAFLERWTGSYLAERLATEWLQQALKQNDDQTASRLVAYLPDWRSVDCERWAGQFLAGQKLDTSLVFSGLSDSAACWTLLSGLRRSGQLQERDVTPFLRAQVESNKPKNAARVADLVLSPDRARAMRQALDNPNNLLSSQATNTQVDIPVITVALGRLARVGDFDRNYAYFRQSWESRLPADEAGWVHAQFGRVSAQRVEARAASIFARSGAADTSVLSHEAQEWRIRAALRAAPIDWRWINQMIEKMPVALRTQTSWVYWNGRAQQAIGQDQAARKSFERIAGEFDFYGQLAVEALGKKITVPALAKAPSATEMNKAHANASLQRALALFDLGWRTEAVREWNFAIRKMSDRELLAAAQLAYDNRILDRAVNTADRTKAEHNFEMRYLSPFKDKMVVKAAAVNLDPAWVFGLIRQESRFIMDARSHVGASGLMQLMPATAAWVAKKIGLQGFTQSQVNNIDVNLTLGTNYLRMVLNDLDDSAVMATAAYNAGPGRPKAWRSTLSVPVEGAIFAETIPFEETRGYVKNVLSNEAYYAVLFTGKPQSLKERLGVIAPSSNRATKLP